MPAHGNRERMIHFGALVSLLVGLVMLVLKVGGYLITGSAAILSDAVESVVHVAATLVVYISTRIMLHPADDNHPYGHGRIEHFSVAFEGGLVLLAGLGIFWAGVDKLLAGHQPANLGWGMAAVGLAAAINLVLGWWLLGLGRRHRVDLLVADGHHVLSDVWTSVAVLVGVALVWTTGVDWLDAAAAMAIAGYVVWVAIGLIRASWRGFLDQADPEHLQEIVAAINEIRDPEWLDIHGLRSRTQGTASHVDLHLVVPGTWTVARAHDQVEDLERHVLARLGCHGTVFVHLDHPPEGLTDDQLRDRYPCVDGPFQLEHAVRLANVVVPAAISGPVAEVASGSDQAR